jgi:hypothetical protein
MRVAWDFLAVVLLVGFETELFAGATVNIPLSQWESMKDRLDVAGKPSVPEQQYCPIERVISGQFRKGLFSGTLTATFKVLHVDGHLRIPILDGEASLGQTTLDGKRTSLLREGNMFTLGVNQPGTYTLRVNFFWGQEMERFERRLNFRLPTAGITQVSVLIPESGIEPELVHGVLTSIGAAGGGTQLKGYLDAAGALDLTWKRRLSHAQRQVVRSQMTLYTLFTVQEAMVSGQSLIDIQVQEGETDRIDLQLPAETEVLDVSGDAVLQWRTDADKGGKLTVLLRYLLDDATKITVTFQFPITGSDHINLRMPLAENGVSMSGAVGILAPAGLNVQVVDFKDASQMELRDLPPPLTSLSTDPFLYGFSYSAKPSITVSVKRFGKVELTGTVIDEMQASSVVIEDGLEITKMKLRIRNNVRQYLSMRLPDGSRLTHSMIDGAAVRPAIVKRNGQDILLFPLHQSEPIRSSTLHYHRVRWGETLSDIANLYYSDPTMWEQILEYNNGIIGSADGLQLGQQLRIPPRSGTQIRESSFIIELAYKRDGAGRLGVAGRRRLELPEIDIENMKVVWHVYFPQAYDLLSFGGNMTQLTAVRYDLFRRTRDFLRQTLWRDAWAGGYSRSEYSNILAKRKAIYREDIASKSREESVLATFPLVGKLYRFRRDLAGMETPRITFLYVPRWLGTPMQWTGFAAALVLTLLFLARRRDWRTWVWIGIGGIALFLLSHYFLGMHRRLVWGIDIGISIWLVRLYYAGARDKVLHFLQMPWEMTKLFTLVNLFILIGMIAALGFVLAFPMFLSMSLLIILAILNRYGIVLRMRAKEAGNE